MVTIWVWWIVMWHVEWVVVVKVRVMRLLGLWCKGVRFVLSIVWVCSEWGLTNPAQP